MRENPKRTLIRLYTRPAPSTIEPDVLVGVRIESATISALEELGISDLRPERFSEIVASHAGEPLQILVAAAETFCVGIQGLLCPLWNKSEGVKLTDYLEEDINLLR